MSSEMVLAGGGVWTEHSVMSMVGVATLIGIKPGAGNSRPVPLTLPHYLLPYEPH